MTSIATGFWAGWIAVLTIVSVAGLVWLTWSVYFSSDDSAEVGDVVWDETLREGTTAAPLWWFWMILALLATSVVYLILYPGFGSYAGVLRWSQGGQIAASLARHEERFGPLRTEIAARTLPELQQDELAMRSASHLFNNHCSACHGPDARGQASLFPDLRDTSWQWGRDEAQLAQTITQGRQAVMPPWQAVLNDVVNGGLRRSAAARPQRKARRPRRIETSAARATEPTEPACRCSALPRSTTTFGSTATRLRPCESPSRAGGRA
jgi:cytochrome c oxidase cbb3-type subunit 3